MYAGVIPVLFHASLALANIVSWPQSTAVLTSSWESLVASVAAAPPEEEHIYSFAAAPGSSGKHITLATQLTVDRFPQLQRLASFPCISAAIYLAFPEDIQELGYAPTEIFHNCSVISVLKPAYTHDSHLYYPINRLRNIAIAAAQSEFTLVSDVDFVPSPNLHDIALRQAILLHSAALQESPTFFRQALVIPCFQSKGEELPESSQSLAFGLEIGRIQLTDKNAGHGPTRVKLMSQLSPQELLYEPQWEPYYIIHTASYPAYNESFTDQGGDKQSHALLLNALGFRYHLATNVWLMHPPRDEKPWPYDRVHYDPEHQQASQNSHFSAAQTDASRYSYFDNYLPAILSQWPFARWPSASPRAAAAQSWFGRPHAQAIWGL